MSYKDLMQGEGDAPSGQLFRWRVATPRDMAAVYGAMPGLGNVVDGKVDKDTIVKGAEFNEKLAARCVVWPRIVLNGDQPGEEDIQAVDISVADMNFLIAHILGSLKSKAADAAKESL